MTSETKHPSRRAHWQCVPAAWVSCFLGLSSCQPAQPEPFAIDAPLLITEVVASNDGVWLDELGEADDFIELHNQTDEPLRLSDYHLSDAKDDGTRLPEAILAPHTSTLIWADGTPAQGTNHMPFKLSADGETVYLSKHKGALVGRVPFPALDTNISFSRRMDNGRALPVFDLCRYPTPGAANTACAAPVPPELPDDVVFQPFAFPTPFPQATAPLTLTELNLRPAQGDAFVELLNTSSAPVDLSLYSLRISPTKPGLPLPNESEGSAIPWTQSPMLQAGERVVVTVSAEAIGSLAQDPLFEGVISVFDVQGGVVDRTDFMSWPVGSILSRPEADAGDFRFCKLASPGVANTNCDSLASRPVGDRLRHLRTPGDFAALAEGGTAVSEQAVKLIVDIAHGNTVHLLSTRSWALHYTFIRETINQEPRLDLCDPAANALFHQGWVAFSEKEYFVTEGRTYLLGTLVKHAGTTLQTLEFAVGDTITGPLMKQAFFSSLDRLPDPTQWWVRPQTPDQVQLIRLVEGQLPLVGPNAPFRGQTYQPLTNAIGFGVLRFVPSGALANTPLDPRTILITDDVPNDITLVGGLITEAFQAPLAHVNVLSKGRGTPNMGLKNARQDPRLMALMGKPVQLSVRPEGFTISETTAAEVDAHWQKQFPATGTLKPRIDTAERRLRSLSDIGFADLPRFGAKSAQLAELSHIQSDSPNCPGGMGTPEKGFAVPLVYSLEHSATSGAQKLIDEFISSPALRQDSEKREVQLQKIREAITKTDVSKPLVEAIEKEISARFGTRAVRLRSSSNTEDLAEFNGAGIYQSTSAVVGDPKQSVASALRLVWASLWSPRAFAERELARIDHSTVGIGVLIHEAFLSEKANGVAVSRSLVDPNDGDIYYINAQFGEASVTNPAPGIATEQVLYRWFRDPPLVYQSRSTFSPTQPVMQLPEIEQLVCRLNAISKHFRPLIDPKQEQPWFAMEVEFKLVLNPDGTKRLAIKQTRPYSFGRADIPVDCRERL